MLVLVCGLPGSGNRFLIRAIRQAAKSLPVNTGVWHGNTPFPTRVERSGKLIDDPDQRRITDIRLVMPVRNPRCRHLSLIREGKDPRNFPEREWRRNVCQFVADNDAFLHVISYEAMVDDPNAVGAELFRVLDLPPVHLDVKDANKKYRGLPKMWDRDKILKAIGQTPTGARR